MSPERASCQERGADAFIDHVMPVIRAVSNETHDASMILMAYSGCFGAMWGSMVADMDQEFATKALSMMTRQIANMDPLEKMQ